MAFVISVAGQPECKTPAKRSVDPFQSSSQASAGRVSHPRSHTPQIISPDRIQQRQNLVTMDAEPFDSAVPDAVRATMALPLVLLDRLAVLLVRLLRGFRLPGA